jgi:hypothetical protein
MFVQLIDASHSQQNSQSYIQQKGKREGVLGKGKPNIPTPFFAVLGFELKASHLLGRCSTTQAMPPTLRKPFSFVVLEPEPSASTT